MRRFTRTVVSVRFEKASNEVRVGLGRPYVVTFSDGESHRQFQTWDRPAPEVGDIQRTYVPSGQPVPFGVTAH